MNLQYTSQRAALQRKINPARSGELRRRLRENKQYRVNLNEKSRGGVPGRQECGKCAEEYKEESGKCF